MYAPHRCPPVGPPGRENSYRREQTADSRLLAGVVEIALAVAMLLAMIPSFAGVPVEGPAVPAPLPAPAPVIVDSAIR